MEVAAQWTTRAVHSILRIGILGIWTKSDLETDNFKRNQRVGFVCQICCRVPFFSFRLLMCVHLISNQSLLKPQT